MSEPARTWPEDTRPTAEQLVRWLLHGLEIPQQWQLDAAQHLLNAADRADDCFNRDHERQGLALWAVTQDLREMEAWLRNLVRDLEGQPEAAAVRRRLREILGDEQEPGSRQRPQPQPLECGAEHSLMPGVRCEKLDGHSEAHASRSDTVGGMVIWGGWDLPEHQEQGAAPHPIAHMTHGRCSLGRISHPPHPGCEGVPEGEPAPTTMIGRRDDLHPCHADGQGPCTAECCPISRGEPTLCAGTHAPNAQGCDASGGGADASWLG